MDYALKPSAKNSCKATSIEVHCDTKYSNVSLNKLNWIHCAHLDCLRASFGGIRVEYPIIRA